jgi:hypothetical protein
MSLLSTSVDTNMNLVGDCHLPGNLIMNMDSQGSSASKNGDEQHANDKNRLAPL